MRQSNYQITSYLLKNFSDLKSEKFFIHSVFKNTVNLTNNKFLFSISTRTNISPINISVDDNLFKLIYHYLQENESININFPYVNLNFTVTNLNDFTLINTKLEKLKFPEEDAIKNFSSLCLNFVNDSESIINIYKSPQPSNFILNKFKILHYNLTQSLRNNDLILYESVLNEIVGLGKGLTPSGDDFLYGMLSSWKTFSLRSKFVTLTESYIIDNQNKFNLISFSFLKSLIDGEISVIVKKIFYNLVMNKDYNCELSELFNHGKTSGADMVTGILTALQNK